jgi:hypothetical protein
VLKKDVINPNCKGFMVDNALEPIGMLFVSFTVLEIPL